MRFFRLAAITVLLLACLVLGSACAGAKGEEGPQGAKGADGVGIQSIANNADGTLTIYLTNGQSYTTGDLTGPQGDKGDAGAAGAAGAKGDTGAQGVEGIQGPPGPNMIVAMGCVDWEGNLIEGYNVSGCAWVDSPPYDRVEITFTNFTYAAGAYVTTITPFFNRAAYPVFNSSGGKLHVVMFDGAGQIVDCGFSFVILEFP
jgi:hypothetical protein